MDMTNNENNFLTTGNVITFYENGWPSDNYCANAVEFEVVVSLYSIFDNFSPGLRSTALVFLNTQVS